MWGHHPAFGEPFLDEKLCRADAGQKVEVLAFHPNGLWEPGDGYDFPHGEESPHGQLQDITQVLPTRRGQWMSSSSRNSAKAGMA